MLRCFLPDVCAREDDDKEEVRIKKKIKLVSIFCNLFGTASGERLNSAITNSFSSLSTLYSLSLCLHMHAEERAFLFEKICYNVTYSFEINIMFLIATRN